MPLSLPICKIWPLLVTQHSPGLLSLPVQQENNGGETEKPLNDDEEKKKIADLSNWKRLRSRW